MDHFEQGYVPSSKEDNFTYEGEDPQQVCLHLKKRILLFVLDIEHLRQNPLFADTEAFLNKFADNLTAIHFLTECAQACSELLVEVSFLMNNILTCNVWIPSYNLEISTLDAVKLYKKNKNNGPIFSSILKAYTDDNPSIDSLLDDLKLLAYELIEENENT